MNENTTNNIGAKNAIRYRGYYYDTESNLYYLNARYYDPQIKRFINCDDTNNLGAENSFSLYNLYSYCGNNPIMGYDPSGEWDWGIFLKGVSIALVGVTAIASVVTAGCATPALAGAIALASGVMCIGFGASEIAEAATGHNVIRDDIRNRIRRQNY